MGGGNGKMKEKKKRKKKEWGRTARASHTSYAE